MFSRLIKKLFLSNSDAEAQNAALQNELNEAKGKIAALENELAEIKALLKKQSQKTSMQSTANIQAKAPSRNTSNKAAYFDMYEYFCNSHDDTAVDVIEYDCEGNVISKKTFSWTSGCDEVTSEGIWGCANRYAQNLIQAGIPLRKKTLL